MSSLPRRALVVRIGALGDVLLTRRLTYSLSHAGFRTTLLAPARHAFLLLADPWIEGVLDSESPKLAGVFAGEWPDGLDQFDQAFVISPSVDLARAAQSSAAAVIRIPLIPARDDLSIAQQWADAGCPATSPLAGSLPSLSTDASRALFPGATLIHPGSGSPSKNWPLERFTQLGRVLDRQGHRVVWVRGPAEAGFPSEGAGSEVLDRPPLADLAATLARARLFIGNDSGVSHLAAAVGAPTIAIYGPTDPRLWRPDGACVQTVWAGAGKLDDVFAENVLDACRKLSDVPQPRLDPDVRH